jgi:LemA protein
VLTAVVEARAKATQIKLDASDLTDPAKLKAFQDAQKQLTGALGRLLAVRENYPDLKSNANFWHCSHQLEYREQYLGSPARLHRRGARLQPVATHIPDAAMG